MQAQAVVVIPQGNGYPIKEGSAAVAWPTYPTLAFVSSERLLSKGNEVCSWNMAGQQVRYG